MKDIRKHYAVTENGSYLMNASIGGIHKDVTDEIKKWSENTSRQGGIADVRFFTLLEEARSAAAKFVGLSKEDVGFSGSTSLNMNYFAQMLKDRSVKKIVTPAVEFPSSTIPWFHHGYEVELIQPRQGRIWIEDLLEKAKNQDAAVVISGVQYLTGQKIDLLLLSKTLEEHDIPLIINGTQLIGQFPIDLSKLKFMAFTASLHKWLGADLGLSLICMPEEERIKKAWPVAGWTGVEDPWSLLNEPPKLISDMGAFQIGTMPFNMIAGAKKAIEVQMSYGTDLISQRLCANAEKLATIIQDKGHTLLSPREHLLDQTGICTFLYDGDLELALKTLEQEKVYCNGRRGSIRASIHFYNNQEDIDRFKEALKLI